MEYKLCLWMTAVKISSANFDTAFRSYDGYVYVFCAIVCAVYGLSAFHTDRCRL